MADLRYLVSSLSEAKLILSVPKPHVKKMLLSGRIFQKLRGYLLGAWQVVKPFFEMCRF